MKQTLQKNERLKSYTKIRDLFERGEKTRIGCFLMYFLVKDSTPSELQMGVSVGSRYFKKAVDRNLLKRRIREAYRKQKQTLADTLDGNHKRFDVFFVFVHQEMMAYADIYRDMQLAIDQLVKKIEHGASR
jgi:ribonuclease P protein component